jgi:hypothetical protein
MEKDIAADFKEIFQTYTPQVMVNHSQPGWPDRMLQCPKSVAVFVEIKYIEVPSSGLFRIPLRQEQAVWLAKWTYRDGRCFLFLGLNDRFGVLAHAHWKSWLRVPTTQYSLRNIDLLFDNKEEVLEWFTDWMGYETPKKRAAKLLANKSHVLRQ